MGSQLLTTREAAIWARLIQAQRGEIAPQVAEYFLSLAFGESDRHRMKQLAERSEGGTLTPEEQTEFDSYLHVGNLLAVMQSRAKMALRHKPHDGSH
jgi:hypothetical protein